MVYIYLLAAYYHFTLDVTKENLLAAEFSAVPAVFLVVIKMCLILGTGEIGSAMQVGSIVQQVTLNTPGTRSHKTYCMPSTGYVPVFEGFCASNRVGSVRMYVWYFCCLLSMLRYNYYACHLFRLWEKRQKRNMSLQIHC